MNFANWKNDLPAGWSVVPLRAVADYEVSNVDKLTDEQEVPVRLCNYVDVYHNEFITSELPFMEATATEAEIEKFGVKVDDVIITKDSESWDDIGIPALIRETAPDLVCGYHLAQIRPRTGKLFGAFLLRALQAKPIRLHLELAANGVTRFGIPKSDIGSMALPIPPVEQQRVIADFLDAETARIDELIASKENLLAILAEKRRALVSRGVTCGLDPNVKMRDSGVPWLGEIPVHWVLVKLGHVAKIGNGSTPNRDNEDYWENGDIPWLNSSVVNQPEVTAANQFVTETALRECHLPLIDPPAVLVGITGQGKTRGLATVLSVRSTINQHMAYVTPQGDHFDTRFLRYVFLAAYGFLRSISDGMGGTKGALTCEAISNLRFPKPSIEEQRLIVSHIERQIEHIDAVAEATQETLVLLRERREAVIAAAVTGQLDVGVA